MRNFPIPLWDSLQCEGALAVLVQFERAAGRQQR